MRFGAEDLLKKFRTPIEVAEAMILGKLGTEEIDLAHDLVTPTVIAAAEARLRLKAQGVLPSASPASPQKSSEPTTQLLAGSRVGIALEGATSGQGAEHAEVRAHLIHDYGHLLMVKILNPDGLEVLFTSNDGSSWYRFEGGQRPGDAMIARKDRAFSIFPLPE